mgnify:CR=1 FL=1
MNLVSNTKKEIEPGLFSNQEQRNIKSCLIRQDFFCLNFGILQDIVYYTGINQA